MKPRFPKRRIPVEVMDRFRLSAAVASEQVLEEHVRSVVEMVEEASDRAPAERLIAAYARLHYLQEQESTKLGERALAMLGRSPSGPRSLGGRRSLLGRLRQRLRGRANPELREWIERHTARVELTVLELHVENALRTLAILEADLTVDEAVAIYSEMLHLRPTLAEMVRLRVLATLHERRHGDVEPLRPDRSALPLRVENHG